MPDGARSGDELIEAGRKRVGSAQSLPRGRGLEGTTENLDGRGTSPSPVKVPYVSAERARAAKAARVPETVSRESDSRR